MHQELIYNQKLYHTKEFSSVEEFENLIFENAECIFGQRAIPFKNMALERNLIDSTGLVFDFSDPINPNCLLVKVSLFTTPALTIFQQTVKLFRLVHFPTAKLLIKYLLPSITLDSSLRKKVVEKTGSDNVEQLIHTALGNCKSILLIMNGESKELMEIDEKYPDTWQTLVDVMYVKKYSYFNDTIISVSRNRKNRDIQFVLDNL